MNPTSSATRGIVTAATVAGVLLGLVDAADTLLGGFTVGLGALGVTAAILVSGASLGLVGFISGLVAALAFRAVTLAGFEVSGAGLGFRGRVLLKGTTAAALVSGCIVAAVLAAFGSTLWLLYGTGRGAMSALLVITVISIAAALVASLALWRFPAARAHVLIWVVALAVLYLLESRLLYMFSRLGKPGYAHAALLPLFILLFGGGGYALFAPVRTFAKRVSITLIAPFFVIASLAVTAAVFYGSDSLRIVLHQRTSLAFRALEFVPTAARHRRSVAPAALLASCPRADAPNAGGVPAPAVAPRETSGPTRPPLRGVVMVLIDSLRADRVEAQRGGEALMPNLVSLTQEGTYFPNLYTTSPGTLKALAALFASRFAEEIEASDTTLTQALLASNIKTIAISGHPHLARAVSGFHQIETSASVEKLADYKNGRASESITEQALRALAELKPNERFFMLVHYFDPHAHYVSNPRYDFGRGEGNRYDAEVRYTDESMGIFLEAVKKQDSVGIVVASDHGDEFWDHRYKRHQLRLYEESSRVPAVLYDPRDRSPHRNERDSSLLDLAPTILDLLAIAVPPSMSGRSLLSLTREPTPVFMRSTNGSKSAVVFRRRKLIVDKKYGIREVYDLVNDPLEQSNIVNEANPANDELACALGNWIKP